MPSARPEPYTPSAVPPSLIRADRFGIKSPQDLCRDSERGCNLQDVYFDDESAEVVISSLRLGDDHESGSLFTNSNWFTFEEDRDRVANDRSTGSLASPSPNAEESIVKASGDDVIAVEDEELADTATSSPEAGLKLEHVGTDKPVEWVQWRESSDANDPSDVLPNGQIVNNDPGTAESSPPSSIALTEDEKVATEPPASVNNSSMETSVPPQTVSENPSSCESNSVDGSSAEVGEDDNKDNTTDDKAGAEVEHE
ncbi:hypothetical protein Fmac_009469 [Flemingia macrophylla]|uniref:Uncharacterized protein n=1 Tax=Flemingia macrophylla TaxID=520843 RepID=A0ABD1N0E4_9FABA